MAADRFSAGSRHAADAPKIGSPKDEPAPDAGEIKWAGGPIRKPPDPDAD